MTEPIDPNPYDGPRASSTSATQGPGSILAGVGITLALHAAALAVCSTIAAVFAGDAANGMVPFIGIGLTQIVYILPVWIACGRLGKTRTAKGLLLGAGITFLLNAACFGIGLALLSSADFR